MILVSKLIPNTYVQKKSESIQMNKLEAADL